MFRFQGLERRTQAVAKSFAPTRCERATERRSRTTARPAGDCGTREEHVGSSRRAPHNARTRAGAVAWRRLPLLEENHRRMRRACFGNCDNPSATRSPRKIRVTVPAPLAPGSRIPGCAASRKGLVGAYQSPGLPRSSGAGRPGPHLYQHVQWSRPNLTSRAPAR